MRHRPLPASAVPFAFLAAAAALLPSGVRAAGGHFDIDDATVLAPGHCQVELWANRAPRADADDLHVGPACRVGPVEIGIDIDRSSVAGESGFAVGPHLKWVTALVADRLAAGVVIGTDYDLRRGGQPVQTAYLPLTWTPSPRWAVNANLGQDRVAGRFSTRTGASVEWSPTPFLTAIGERGRVGGSLVSRLGLRVAVDGTTSVDLSAARVAGTTGPLYTVGLNRDFAR